MKKELRKRLEKVQSLDENILLFNLENMKDPNFIYLTGKESRNSFMWIPKGDDPKIITHEMEARRLKDLPYEIETTDSVFKRVNSIIKDKNVGTNGRILPWKLGKKLKGKLTDASSELEKIRQIKTKMEIEKITKAQRESENIFKKLEIKEGVKENHIVRQVRKMIIDKDLEEAFETISAGGANAASPHHTFSRDKIKEVFYIDWGVKFDHYNSDCTRSFVFADKHKDKLELLDHTIKSVEDELEPGVNASDMHNLAVKELGDYSDMFIHSLGHGVGIEVHEGPSLSPKSDDTIEEGMVFTVEPGIYADKWGLRVENMYVMEKNGPKRITKLPNIIA